MHPHKVRVEHLGDIDDLERAELRLLARLQEPRISGGARARHLRGEAKSRWLLASNLSRRAAKVRHAAVLTVAT